MYLVVTLCREDVSLRYVALGMEVYSRHAPILISLLRRPSLVVPEASFYPIARVNRSVPSVCSLLWQEFGIHEHQALVLYAQRIRDLVIIVIESGEYVLRPFFWDLYQETLW